MNKIKPSAICKQEIVTGTTEANRINIVNFLKAAELYGVPAKFLFEVQVTSLKVYIIIKKIFKYLENFSVKCQTILKH